MSSRIAVGLLCVGLIAAAPPPALTPAQRAKLAERDRLEKELPKLLEAKQHDKAITAMERVVTLGKEVLGETHVGVLGSLERLAGWRERLDQFPAALRARAELLWLQEKRLGKGHWQITDARLGLQLCKRLSEMTAEDRNRVRQAEEWYRQMMRMSEQGQAKAALELGLKVRDLRREVLGPGHPRYAASLNNLALLYHAMGETAKAGKLARAALIALDNHLEETFNYFGEQQRAQVVQSVLYGLGSLQTLQEQLGEPIPERYAPVLARKGRAADRGGLDRLVRDHPELSKTLSELQSVRARLVRLGLQTPPHARQADHLKDLEGLSENKQRLEGELSRLSSVYRQRKERQRLTPARLSQEVPTDTAFVDLLEYTHHTPPRGGKGQFEGEQRLLAFITRRGEEPALVRLGAMAPIAEAVAKWRADAEKDPRKADREALGRAGDALREKLWLPLTKHLGGAKTVIVAPDGALCQFPLAALPGSKPGTYLIEEVAIAQVASAHHLLDVVKPIDDKPRKAAGLLALGGVDYGPGTPYRALPGTATEARRCQHLFREAHEAEPAALLTGQAATVAAVQRAVKEKAPRYLHLATHGYFEPPDRLERLLKAASRTDGLSLAREQTAVLQSLPLLRCGLALAGANAAGDDPRILTGEDVEQLDLRGCEVAVLSACQTGLGDVKRSQGVLGLQRSFHAAGARTLVTSLWNVSDPATAELMEEFYARLWGKEKVSRLEALCQAQIAILKDPGRVARRAKVLLADARKQGLTAEQMRGVTGRVVHGLPDGDKPDDAPKRSPVALWAGFVLSGEWR